MVADALAQVAERLGVGKAEVLTTLFGSWEAVVGDTVAAHVQPLRVDGDCLIVGVDHSAWVTQIRRLAPQILERVREICGETGAPSRLQVRVRR
jgi:predicted nucleic acid-binding Zn ribbon protein